MNGSDKILFEKLDKYDAGCMAVNSLGQVGGWIGGIDPNDRGQHSHRPALWDSTGQLVDLLDGERLLGADWGYVAALDDRGHALVVAYVRHQPISMIWRAGEGAVQISDSASGIIAVDVSDSMVVGFANNAIGEPVSLTYQGEQGWARLEVEDGWYPTAVAEDRVIIGRVRRDGFFTPAVGREEESTELSTYMFHNAQAVAALSTGQVIGQAQADHGIHALLWIPTT